MAGVGRRLSLVVPTLCKNIRNCSTISRRLQAKVILSPPCQIKLSRSFASTQPLAAKETVSIHFTNQDGVRMTAKAKIGDNLLDVILENNIDIDGFGACEGTLACSTCHLLFTKDQFSLIPDQATDEELDMLDLAYGLTDTSRLGCQVIVTKDMEDWEVCVPSGVSDAREL